MGEIRNNDYEGYVTELANKSMHTNVDWLKQESKPTCLIFVDKLLEEIHKKDKNKANKYINERLFIINEAIQFLSEVESGEFFEENNLFSKATLTIVTYKSPETRIAQAIFKLEGEVIASGIARCSDYDIYNEHLGKAIAVSRALNLNCDLFLNAPQITKLAYGQKVISLDDQAEYTVVYAEKLICLDKDGKEFYFRTEEAPLFQIAEDTHAQY